VAGAGALTTFAGGALGTVGADLAEEFGDFVTDAAGIRRPKPYPGAPNQDPHYDSGRTDGMGQQLNRWVAKNAAGYNPGEWVGPIGVGPTRGW